MPLGKPNAQTRANERWQKKAGYKVKSFKLRTEIVDDFSETCEKNGCSQASVITELMERYIAENQ